MGSVLFTRADRQRFEVWAPFFLLVPIGNDFDVWSPFFLIVAGRQRVRVWAPFFCFSRRDWPVPVQVLGVCGILSDINLECVGAFRPSGLESANPSSSVNCLGCFEDLDELDCL